MIWTDKQFSICLQTENIDYDTSSNRPVVLNPSQQLSKVWQFMFGYPSLVLLLKECSAHLWMPACPAEKGSLQE